MNPQTSTRFDGAAAVAMIQRTSLISNASEPSVTQLSIKTRFGEVIVDTAKAIVFTRGLLGMPERTRFALANFPNAKMQQFRLLQSLDDHNLSFITLPLDLENGIIAANDLRVAAADLGIKEENLATLLIVSVHRSPDQVKLSVNARAPIFVDAERKVGIQYVFQHDAYKVQHML
jgi:flagellar assembly factor FliW